MSESPSPPRSRVRLQCGDLRRLQCPVRREAIPLEATFALAIGLLLRHVIQHRELLDLRSRRSPPAPHSRAFNIQQVDSGLAGVACAFDRRHHPKGEETGPWPSSGPCSTNDHERSPEGTVGDASPSLSVWSLLPSGPASVMFTAGGGSGSAQSRWFKSSLRSCLARGSGWGPSALPGPKSPQPRCASPHVDVCCALREPVA